MTLKLSEREIDDMHSCLADLQYRLPAEFYLVRDNNLPSQLIDDSNYNRITRPTKWRLKVWKALLKTAFRKLENFEPSKTVASCAEIIGFFQSCIHTTDTFDEIENEIIEKVFKDIPDIQVDEKETEEYLTKLTNLLDRERFAELVRKEEPGALGEFYSNYGEGLKTIGHVDTSGNVQFDHGTTATQIYMFLLVFGDMLEKQRTVKRVYDIYCLQFENSKAPHQESSFRQICHDLGFTGSLYRTRKRRTVSA